MRRDRLLLEDIVAAADAVAEFQVAASFDRARIMAAQSRDRKLVVASAWRAG